LVIICYDPDYRPDIVVVGNWWCSGDRLSSEPMTRRLVQTESIESLGETKGREEHKKGCTSIRSPGLYISGPVLLPFLAPATAQTHLQDPARCSL
jgi:hypothetical protein